MLATDRLDILQQLNKLYPSNLNEHISKVWYAQSSEHCLLIIRLKNGDEEIIRLNGSDDFVVELPVTFSCKDDIIDNACKLLHTDLYWLCYISDILFNQEFKRVTIAMHHNHE